MPELPEIETIKRGLEEKIIGKEIVEVKLFDVSPANKPYGQFFEDDGTVEDVKGSAIESVRRKGKALIIDLDNSLSLLFHLKMTGQLVLVEPEGDRFGGGHPTKSLKNELPDKTTRTVFIFDDDSKLFFNDQRKFGYIKLKKTAQLESEPFLSRLGPDAIGPEFTSEKLYEKLEGRKANIKAILLDQSIIAGIGNIYADESLHMAKIHPERKAGEVTKDEAKKLTKAIKAILNESIEKGGTTFTNYVNHLGKKGDYLESARVFQRRGEECPVCGATIKKIKVAGRGTHLCEDCQK